MSEYDYALINATWLNLTNEEFQCSKTEALLNKRRDADIAIRAVREKKGCGVIKDSPKVEIGSIAYHSCLCHENFQYPKMGYLIHAQRNYEKGILPFSGGTFDQPAQIMEMIALLSTLQAEHEYELQEKANKANKKGK